MRRSEIQHSSETQSNVQQIKDENSQDNKSKDQQSQFQMQFPYKDNIYESDSQIIVSNGQFFKYQNDEKSKQLDQQEQVLNQSTFINQARVVSQSFEQYNLTISRQYFNGQETDHSKILQIFAHQIFNTCQLLNKNTEKDSGERIDKNVKFKRTKVKQFQIKSIKTTQNCQVVVFNVQLGDFQINISMLNVLHDLNYEVSDQRGFQFANIVHQLPKIGMGNFGTVFMDTSSQHVIKCVKLENLNKQMFDFLNLRQVIYEIAFLKLTKVLKIGPQLNSLFGFDMIHYPNCVQFSMQRCLSPNQIQCRSVLSTISKDLYEVMSKLHLLNICHGDIKPQNIMFCKSLQKWIFVDFGLSHINTQPLGQKSLSRFVGTYQYASPQMKQLVYSNEAGRVDLYYNDLNALELSLKELIQSFPDSYNQYQKKSYKCLYQKNLSQSDNDNHQSCFKSMINTYKLQYILSSTETIDWTLIDQLVLKDQNIFRLWQGMEIVKFLLELNPTEDLLLFINKYLRGKQITFQVTSLKELHQKKQHLLGYHHKYVPPSKLFAQNQMNYKNLFGIYTPTKIMTYLLPTNLRKCAMNMKRIKGINNKIQMHHIHQNSIIILSYLQRRNILLGYDCKNNTTSQWDFSYCLIDYFLGQKIKLSNKSQEMNTIRQKILVGSLLWDEIQKNQNQSLYECNEFIQAVEKQGNQLKNGDFQNLKLKKKLKEIQKIQKNNAQMINDFQKASPSQRQKIKSKILEQFKNQVGIDQRRTTNTRKLFLKVGQYCISQYVRCKQIIKQWNVHQNNPKKLLQFQFYIKNHQTLKQMLTKLIYVFDMLQDQEKIEQILNLLRPPQLAQFSFQIMHKSDKFFIKPQIIFQNQLDRLYNYALLIVNFADFETEISTKIVKKIQEQIVCDLKFIQQIQESAKQAIKICNQFNSLLQCFKNIILACSNIMRGQYYKSIQTGLIRVKEELNRILQQRQNIVISSSIGYKYLFLCNFMLARLFRLTCITKSIQYAKTCDKIISLQYKYNNFQHYLVGSFLISSYISLNNWRQAKLINQSMGGYLNYDLQILAVQFQQKLKFECLELCIDMILIKNQLDDQEKKFQFVTVYAKKTMHLVKKYPNFDKYYKLAQKTIQQMCQTFSKQGQHIEKYTQNKFYHKKDQNFVLIILIQWYWYFHHSQNKQFNFQVVYQHLKRLLQNNLKSRTSEAKILQLKAILHLQRKQKQKALQCMFNCGQFIVHHQVSVGQCYETCINVALVLRRQFIEGKNTSQIRHKYYKTFTQVTNIVFEWIHVNEYTQKLFTNLQMTKNILQTILSCEFRQKIFKASSLFQKKLTFIFVSLSFYVNRLRNENVSLFNNILQLMHYFFRILLQRGQYYNSNKSEILQKLAKHVLQISFSKNMSHKQVGTYNCDHIQNCQIMCFYLWHIIKSGYQFIPIFQVRIIVIKLFKLMQNLLLKQSKVLFRDYFLIIGIVLEKINSKKDFLKVNKKSLQKLHLKFNQNSQTNTQAYCKLFRKLVKTQHLSHLSCQVRGQIIDRLILKLHKYSSYN